MLRNSSPTHGTSSNISNHHHITSSSVSGVGGINNRNQLLPSDYINQQEVENCNQQQILSHGPFYDPQYRTPPPPSFDEQFLGKWHSTGHVPDPMMGTSMPQSTRIYRGSLGTLQKFVMYKSSVHYMRVCMFHILKLLFLNSYQSSFVDGEACFNCHKYNYKSNDY